MNNKGWLWKRIGEHLAPINAEKARSAEFVAHNEISPVDMTRTDANMFRGWFHVLFLADLVEHQS